ncbi:MAG TPA: hypothetical protein VM575_04150 [Nocardioides sp.]|nr:hypothetical protein [Nocardioides sp.]
MRTNQLTHKHRASQPIPVADRPDATRAHRAARPSDLPIAAILGILLVLVAVYFTVRG